MDEFERLNRNGLSILIVTHDSKIASSCSRVLYLVDGRIAGEYRPDKDFYKEKDRNERLLNQWLSNFGW